MSVDTAGLITGPGWSRTRRIAFYVAVALGLLSVAITGPALTLPVTAWLPETVLDKMFGQSNLGIHRVHMVGGSLLFWLTIAAMAAQVRHPEHRAGPLWAAAVAWAVFLPLELTHLIDPFSIVVTALVLSALALHPRRWPGAGIEWRSGPMLLAFVGVAAGLTYAFRQVVLQLGASPQDPHGAGSHYALMAALTLGVCVTALIGATNFPGQRIAAWITGVVALTMGVFFAGHPMQASSVGTATGLALGAWAVTYLFVSAGGGSTVRMPTHRAQGAR